MRASIRTHVRAGLGTRVSFGLDTHTLKSWSVEWPELAKVVQGRHIAFICDHLYRSLSSLFIYFTFHNYLVY